MRYEITVRWCDEDEIFVAEVPELPGCLAHGPTEAAAIESVKEAMALWIEVSRRSGESLPSPRRRVPA